MPRILKLVGIRRFKAEIDHHCLIFYRASVLILHISRYPYRLFCFVGLFFYRNIRCYFGHDIYGAAEALRFHAVACRNGKAVSVSFLANQRNLPFKFSCCRVESKISLLNIVSLAENICREYSSVRSQGAVQAAGCFYPDL